MTIHVPFLRDRRFLPGAAVLIFFLAFLLGQTVVQPDVNGDGVVSIADVIAVDQHMGERFLQPPGAVVAPIPVPPPPGMGPGANETAIANYDLVPYADYSDFAYIGVQAYHISGIKEVWFQANGGPVQRATQRTKNKGTGVNDEYVAVIRVPDFPPGILNISAIVYPTIGIPRQLGGLPINANPGNVLPNVSRYVSTTGSDTTGDGTQAKPFATTAQAAWSIQQAQGDVNGGIIYLTKGTYTLTGAQWWNNATNSTRYLTLCPAPGLGRSDVVLAGMDSPSSGGFNLKLLCVRGLTITGQVSTGQGGDVVWLDDVLIDGCGDGATNAFPNKYVTNSTIKNSNACLTNYKLMRNITFDNNTGDALQFNTGLAANIAITNFNPLAGAHSNVYQATGDATNVILYNVKLAHANVQCCQVNGVVNGLAIVNSDWDATYPLAIGGAPRHQLLIRSKFTGSVADYGGFLPVDNLVDTCELNGAPMSAANYSSAPGVTYR